jgi:hypothetical protein
VAREKPKKKAKTFPASTRITPEFEVPPNPSPSTNPRKDEEVIKIDDELENVGDSGKDASASMPYIEAPVKTTTNAPANDASKDIEVAHGTPSTHPHFFPVLRKVPFHQHYKEITGLMNEVWGHLETKQQEMADFKDFVPRLLRQAQSCSQGNTIPQALDYAFFRVKS